MHRGPYKRKLQYKAVYHRDLNRVIVTSRIDQSKGNLMVQVDGEMQTMPPNSVIIMATRHGDFIKILRNFLNENGAHLTVDRDSPMST